MILIQIMGVIFLCYCISKALTIDLQNENTKLKKELEYIKKQRDKEQLEYRQRIKVMNEAFNLFKGQRK